MYPEGTTGTYAKVNVIITEKGVSTTLDGMVETSISFEADGTTPLGTTPETYGGVKWT